MYKEIIKSISYVLIIWNYIINHFRYSSIFPLTLPLFRYFIQSKICGVSQVGWYFLFIRCDLIGTCLFTTSKNMLFQTSTISFISSKASIVSHGTSCKSFINIVSSKFLNDLYVIIVWWVFVFMQLHLALFSLRTESDNPDATCELSP